MSTLLFFDRRPAAAPGCSPSERAAAAGQTKNGRRQLKETPLSPNVHLRSLQRDLPAAQNAHSPSTEPQPRMRHLRRELCEQGAPQVPHQRQAQPGTEQRVCALRPLLLQQSRAQAPSKSARARHVDPVPLPHMQ